MNIFSMLPETSKMKKLSPLSVNLIVAICLFSSTQVYAQGGEAAAPASEAAPAAEPAKPEAAPEQAPATEAKPEAAPQQAAPAPATPAATPSDAPTPAEKPSEAADDKSAKTEDKVAEPPKGWHDDTPPEIANKLSLGMLGGIGAGKATGYSSDHVGFGFLSTYDFMSPGLLPGDALFAEGRYFSQTGIEVEKDISRVVQYTMFGAGLRVKFHPESKLDYSATALVGLLRTVGLEQASVTIADSSFKPAFGANARAKYTFLEKLGGFGGVGAYMGNYSWFDVEAGLMASF